MDYESRNKEERKSLEQPHCIEVYENRRQAGILCFWSVVYNLTTLETLKLKTDSKELSLKILCIYFLTVLEHLLATTIDDNRLLYILSFLSGETRERLHLCLGFRKWGSAGR